MSMDLLTIPYNKNWNFSTLFCKCANGVAPACTNPFALSQLKIGFFQVYIIHFSGPGCISQCMNGTMQSNTICKCGGNLRTI